MKKAESEQRPSPIVKDKILRIFHFQKFYFLFSITNILFSVFRKFQPRFRNFLVHSRPQC